MYVACGFNSGLGREKVGAIGDNEFLHCAHSGQGPPVEPTQPPISISQVSGSGTAETEAVMSKSSKLEN